VSPDVELCLHNNQIDNLERGILERVFYVKGKSGFERPPLPGAKVVNARLKKQASFMKKWLAGSTPVSCIEFANLYEGRKRLMNMQAALELELTPIRKKDAHISAFIKAEKSFTSASKTMQDIVPRIISPTSRRYLVALGRFLKPLEKKLVQGVDELFGEKTIMKGLNADQSGEVVHQKWKKYDKPAAIGLDASRFDQHVSVDVLKAEHAIYLGAFPNEYKQELSRLLSWQLHPRGTGRCSDGLLRYKVDGTRTSGCINTGMGNCLMMSIMIHSYMASIWIRKYSLMNNGDDCVIICETSVVKQIQKSVGTWFLEMGFNMKMERPVYRIEEIEFCQTHPVFVFGSYRMVRNAPMSFAKDSVSIKPIDHPSARKKWLYAVALGGMALTTGLPVCQSFYQYYLRISNSIKHSNKGSKRTQQRRRANKIWGTRVWRQGSSRYYKV
jgi:hypothetical protein